MSSLPPRPIHGPPASDAFRLATLDDARRRWAAFRETPRGATCPPGVAELAMEHMLTYRGKNANWDRFEIRPFERFLRGRFPEHSTDVRFMYLGSMAMFLATLAPLGIVSRPTVERAFLDADAFDPGEPMPRSKRARRR